MAEVGYEHSMRGGYPGTWPQIPDGCHVRQECHVLPITQFAYCRVDIPFSIKIRASKLMGTLVGDMRHAVLVGIITSTSGNGTLRRHNSFFSLLLPPSRKCGYADVLMTH